MNNPTVLQNLIDCSDELQKIQESINFVGQSHSIVPFLTNYAIIKCCGTIENSFKTIIADFHNTLPQQAKNYIEETFYKSPMNPSQNNIHSSLEKFDPAWNLAFKTKLSLEANKSRIESSLKSLNHARNEFAHGGRPTVSFQSIFLYFNDAKRIIEILDEVVQ
jgi:hypothetical protein